MRIVTFERSEMPSPAGREEYDQLLESLTSYLSALPWIQSLVVCGSYAKGSLAPGWSDLDLVATYSDRLPKDCLSELGVDRPGMFTSNVAVGIDFVSCDVLTETRRVAGRPLAMSLELREYSLATFGTNLFHAIDDHPDDKARVQVESEIFLRAEANNWLRRSIAGYNSPEHCIYDATKTLLKIAMFESSPIEKSSFHVADYCQAALSAASNEHISLALDLAQDIRLNWGQKERLTASMDHIAILEGALRYYCERWSPCWEQDSESENAHSKECPIIA